MLVSSTLLLPPTPALGYNFHLDSLQCQKSNPVLLHISKVELEDNLSSLYRMNCISTINEHRHAHLKEKKKSVVAISIMHCMLELFLFSSCFSFFFFLEKHLLWMLLSLWNLWSSEIHLNHWLCLYCWKPQWGQQSGIVTQLSIKSVSFLVFIWLKKKYVFSFHGDYLSGKIQL